YRGRHQFAVNRMASASFVTAGNQKVALEWLFVSYGFTHAVASSLALDFTSFIRKRMITGIRGDDFEKISEAEDQLLEDYESSTGRLVKMYQQDDSLIKLVLLYIPDIYFDQPLISKSIAEVISAGEITDKVEKVLQSETAEAKHLQELFRKVGLPTRAEAREEIQERPREQMVQLSHEIDREISYLRDMSDVEAEGDHIFALLDQLRKLERKAGLGRNRGKASVLWKTFAEVVYRRYLREGRVPNSKRLRALLAQAMRLHKLGKLPSQDRGNGVSVSNIIDFVDQEGGFTSWEWIARRFGIKVQVVKKKLLNGNNLKHLQKDLYEHENRLVPLIVSERQFMHLTKVIRKMEEQKIEKTVYGISSAREIYAQIGNAESTTIASAKLLFGDLDPTDFLHYHNRNMRILNAKKGTKRPLLALVHDNSLKAMRDTFKVLAVSEFEGRITYEELGERLGLPANSIWRRIQSIDFDLVNYNRALFGLPPVQKPIDGRMKKSQAPILEALKAAGGHATAREIAEATGLSRKQVYDRVSQIDFNAMNVHRRYLGLPELAIDKEKKMFLSSDRSEARDIKVTLKELGIKTSDFKQIVFPFVGFYDIQAVDGGPMSFVEAVLRVFESMEDVYLIDKRFSIDGNATEALNLRQHIDMLEGQFPSIRFHLVAKDYFSEFKLPERTDGKSVFIDKYPGDQYGMFRQKFSYLSSVFGIGGHTQIGDLILSRPPPGASLPLADKNKHLVHIPGYDSFPSFELWVRYKEDSALVGDPEAASQATYFHRSIIQPYFSSFDAISKELEKWRSDTEA
ncbi:MAG: AsnC family protein, partial [Candidatus Omnitrophica bacterium]|nr:AsnC family protein [Candidatus Omnitrophota bacterium]